MTEVEKGVSDVVADLWAIAREAPSVARVEALGLLLAYYERQPQPPVPVRRVELVVIDPKPMP